MAEENNSNALPQGYQLHWYEILDMLGRGGFGITYLARDKNLDMMVAIKEYLPEDFASRKDNSTVQPRTEIQTEIYQWGLDRFVTEARILAKFTHPNIVRVISVFEYNNTAYMVMEYAQGEDLSTVYKRRSRQHEPLTEQEYLDIFVPICDGLSLVHKEGFIHRDIKPANIYLCNDAQPLLLDFGSARQSVEHKTKALTSLVTVGFAPFEQYQEGTGKQGPWTDIYALGASIYMGITGNKPEDALGRGGQILETGKDTYKPLSKIATGSFSEHFLLAVDRALMFKAEDRPNHILRWADMLLGRIPAPALPEDLFVSMDPEELEKTVVMPASRQTGRQSQRSRPTTASSRGSQGLVDSLGKRLIEISHEVEKPVEAGLTRFVQFVKKRLNALWRYIFGLPANALFAAATALVLIIGLAVVVATIPESSSVSDSPVSQQASETGVLLKSAEKAITKKRYTRPKGKSAYDYLQSVLRIDADNDAAQAMLQEMRMQLSKQAQQKLAAGDYDKALSIANELLIVDPGSQQAKSLKNKINAEKNRGLEISRLLSEAATSIKNKQFVRPENTSAYDYYSQVLNIDKTNREAVRGVENLASTLLASARTAYGKADYVQAGQYLNDLDAMGHSSSEASSLRKQVEEKLDKNQKISDMLSTAKKYIRQQQYSTPEGKNAYDVYVQVLQLDKSNAEAKSGINRIKNYYKNQFDKHIAKQDFGRANYDLQRIRMMAPGSSLERSMARTLKQKQKVVARKPDIERVSELIGQFKQSLEQRDIKKNQQLSRYKPGRESFLKQLFSQYRTINVKISGFQFIGKERRATARVELYNLVDKSNNAVRPGDWSKFDIVALRGSNGRFYIEW